MLNSRKFPRIKARQRGASAVEFGLIAVLFFTLFFGIIEFGRLFYLYNTVQEVTRCVARQATVKWTDQWGNIKQQCLFGGTSLPFGAEITAGNINIEYLTASEVDPTPFPSSAADNMSACESEPDGCIALVRVSIVNASYTPMVGGFAFLSVSMPPSTVTMSAESLGY